MKLNETLSNEIYSFDCKTFEIQLMNVKNDIAEVLDSTLRTEYHKRVLFLGRKYRKSTKYDLYINLQYKKVNESTDVQVWSIIHNGLKYTIEIDYTRDIKINNKRVPRVSTNDSFFGILNGELVLLFNGSLVKLSNFSSSAQVQTDMPDYITYSESGNTEPIDETDSSIKVFEEGAIIGGIYKTWEDIISEGLLSLDCNNWCVSTLDIKSAYSSIGNCTLFYTDDVNGLKDYITCSLPDGGFLLCNRIDAEFYVFLNGTDGYQITEDDFTCITALYIDSFLFCRREDGTYVLIVDNYAFEMNNGVLFNSVLGISIDCKSSMTLRQLKRKTLLDM